MHLPDPDSPDDASGDRAARFRETALLVKRLERDRLKLERLENALKDSQAQLGDCRYRLKMAGQKTQALHRKLTKANEALATARSELATTTQSLSWRITAPLRKVRGRFF